MRNQCHVSEGALFHPPQRPNVIEAINYDDRLLLLRGGAYKLLDARFMPGFARPMPATLYIYDNASYVNGVNAGSRGNGFAAQKSGQRTLRACAAVAYRLIQ